MDQFPIEILFEIAKFLNIKSQINLRSISNKFHNNLWIKNFKQFCKLTYDPNCLVCCELIRKNNLAKYCEIKSRYNPAGCIRLYLGSKEIKKFLDPLEFILELIQKLLKFRIIR